MSEREFGRFEPPINLTDFEWAALDAFRAGAGLGVAARRLGIGEKQLRVVVKNAAEKLRLAASALRPGAVPSQRCRNREVAASADPADGGRLRA